MRVVLDANVLIEGLTRPQSSSGRLLDGILSERVRVVWCDEVMDDYAVVLGFDAFGLDAGRADKLLAFFKETGEKVQLSGRYGLKLPAAGDAPYYCCAADSGYPLVTGNRNNYPANGPVEIADPARVMFK
ncbi:MAG: PIN domain-containing protein [Gammaproteobacteria bacterium]|nr:PIN domain-containing protein [Gammaproteobacteria bacterium]